jgi:phenylalanyl-tRNA synthetase alpha chain
MRDAADDEFGLDQLLQACDWTDQAYVAGAGLELADAALVRITENESKVVHLGPTGESAHANGLLEVRLWQWLSNQEQTSRSIADLNSAGFDKSESGPGIGLLKKLGIGLERGSFVVPEDESEIVEIISQRTALIEALATAGDAGVDAVELDSELIEHFHSRSGLIIIEEVTSRTWSLTEAGRRLPESELSEELVIGEITPELLHGDAWKNAQYKPYDVNLEAPIPAGGRPHPMRSLVERIRSIFLEMGFTEIEGDFVQTAGWNMDALFIPQTHPARAMQDTFYLDEPKKIPIDDASLDSWADVHERGGDTGSRGWGGIFDREEAQKGLLRTHTTVNTVRHLHENPGVACRVFGIGRVFRQEAIDKSHLPEFHQIEGIIHEESANLPMLVTTLKTFYAKMGYPDVRVRPAYFPYTEPSLEVEVKWRGEWLELGGAGIFRPEVTEPLGCSWPVCAWGMGLERLAMLVLGLDDIRQLYQPDLAKLRDMPLL